MLNSEEKITGFVTFNRAISPKDLAEVRKATLVQPSVSNQIAARWNDAAIKISRRLRISPILIVSKVNG